MHPVEISVDVVAIFGGIVLTVFAFARLEFLSKQNKSDLDEFKTVITLRIEAGERRHDDFGADIRKIGETLARLEGYLLKKE